MKRLFKTGDRVRHWKGGIYRIIRFCPIDGYYEYRSEASGEVWRRHHLEMEDGRFTVIERGEKK